MKTYPLMNGEELAVIQPPANPTGINQYTKGGKGGKHTQITKVSAHSLRAVAKQNAKGNKIVGYTTRPGFSNGLNMTSKQTPKKGKYVGY